MHASVRGVGVGIPLLCDRGSNLVSRTGTGRVSGGQFDWGGRLPKSNGGARKVRSAWSATRLQSARAQAGLTARLTSRAGTKVGSSDPAAQSGMAVAQRIKGTPGITG